MDKPASRPGLLSARAPDSGLSCPAPGCGRPLRGRQRACSNVCRAALSRRRRDEAQAARDQEIRGLLEAALRRLEPPS
jgi:hypothetical protein